MVLNKNKYRFQLTIFIFLILYFSFGLLKSQTIAGQVPAGCSKIVANTQLYSTVMLQPASQLLDLDCDNLPDLNLYSLRGPTAIDGENTAQIEILNPDFEICVNQNFGLDVTTFYNFNDTMNCTGSSSWSSDFNTLISHCGCMDCFLPCSDTNLYIAYRKTSGIYPVGWIKISFNLSDNNPNGIELDILEYTMLCSCQNLLTVQNDVACTPGCEGSATSQLLGASMPVSYSWSTGDTTSTITDICAGTYIVTASNTTGCSVTDTVIVSTTPPMQCFIDATAAQVSLCNGSLSVYVSNGSTPYTYLWSNGQTQSTISSLCTGNYSVTVTDSNGCVTNCNANVTDANAFYATEVEQQNISCFGSCNAIWEIVTSNGAPPFTFSISNGQTITTSDSSLLVSSLCSGIYTYSVTDNNGNTVSNNFYVSQPAQLTVSATVYGTSCGTNSGIMYLAASGGTPPYQYSNNGGTTWVPWYNFFGLAAGIYYPQVMDANGCTASITVTVGQFSPVQIISVTTINPSCNGGCDGSLVVNAVGGAGTLTYELNAGAAQSSNVFNGLCAGLYQIIIYDQNWCTTWYMLTITQPPPITISTNVLNPDCGNCTGSIEVVANGGTPPYYYSNNCGLYFDTSNILNGLCAGYFCISIVDSLWCAGNTGVTIPFQSGFATSTMATSVTCNGFTDGSIDVSTTGGFAPFTFELDPPVGPNLPPQSDSLFSNLSPGNYAISIEDSIGCLLTIQSTITEPPPITLSGNLIQPDCGICNGIIGLNANGGSPPYYYDITCGVVLHTNNIFNNLCNGTYCLYVQDTNGCSITILDTVPLQSGFEIDVTTNQVTCAGLSDGEIDISVNGGNQPFIFDINSANGSNPPTGSNSNFANLSSGNYQIIVTDSLGCLVEDSAQINEPSPLYFTIDTVTQASCNSCYDGSASISIFGGTPPYAVTWYNSQSAIDSTFANDLGSGWSLVCVTDSNSCSYCDSIYIDFVDGISSTISESDISVYPNPSTGIFYFNTGNSLPVNLDIFNSNLKLIESQKVNANQFNIDLSRFDNGIYFFRFTTYERKQVMGKLTVIK